MSLFSEGYYDLSITKKLSCAVLTTCEVTTRTVIEYFFTTELGINSGLQIEEYGHTYILGLTQAPHKYDKEGTEKEMIVTMVGKSTSDSLSNDLPSNKNYGFKTNMSYPIFSREIESFVVIPWHSARISKEKESNKQKLLYTPHQGQSTKTVLPAPHLRKKSRIDSEVLREKKYDCKTCKVPKSKMNAGGASRGVLRQSLSESHATNYKPVKGSYKGHTASLERFLVVGNTICHQVGNGYRNPVAEYVSKDGKIMIIPTRGLNIRPNSLHERLYNNALSYGNKHMIKRLVNVSKLRIV
jgi:hypothetical protein